MSSTKVFADVIVITKGRYTNKAYTYIVPKHLSKKIEVNDLVKVPYNNREVNGIIRKVYNKVLNDEYSYLHINSVSFNVDTTLLNYIEKISDYYINPLGHSISYYFFNFLNQKKVSEFKVNRSSEYNFNIDCRDLLLNNLNEDSINIIYCPSLKSISDLSEYLESRDINITFKQSAGGIAEQKLLDKKISDSNKGVILALTTSIFNPQLHKSEMYKHFWDINHYKYNESRKPNFNLIDVANIQNTYTHHKHIYYSEFPNYRYVTVNENIKFKLPNVDIKYFYGSTVLEALNSLVSHENNSVVSKATFNLDFCSNNIKNMMTDYFDMDDSIGFYKEASKISKYNILVEPTISHNKILNSASLAKLVRYLNRLSNSNSLLFVITTNNNELLNTLTEENINLWLTNEFAYRSKYGPNHEKKVIEINSKDTISVENLGFKGPIKDEINSIYKYQLTYSYNDSYQANIYEKIKKFDYSFINYF